MGHLWRRTRRIVRGKLAGLAGGRPEPLFEPDAARTTSGAASTREDDERARARAVLEVEPGASPDEIRSAYRRLCRRYHPDRFDADAARSRAANELLAEINRAYALLGEEGR
jgi:DnaJ-domain-containing protein 1